jgi:hypothetical protein
MPVSQPVASLDRLFLETAEAAARAQAMLDTQSLERTRLYSIPRVDVNAKFGLDTDSHTGLIGLLFGKDSQRSTHNLQFALRATPGAPDASGLESDLPTDRRTVSEPAWMVSVPERRHLADVLTLALRMNRCTIEVDVPGAVDFYPEADAIENALTNTDDDSIGMVFFRISAEPAQYLIVRVGDAGIHNGHDGLFVLTPDAQTPVAVFDFLHSPKSSSIRYEPVGRLVTLLGPWLAAGMPGERLESGNIPATFGAIPFGDLAQDLWASYVAARQAVAAKDAARQAVYALENVTAQFAHAVPAAVKDDGDDTALPYIYSRVDLSIASDRLTGKLVSPEYLLVEDARAAFLAQVAKNVDAIVAESQESEREAWRTALSGTRSRGASLVTLSYTGGKPKNSFLAVTPAVWNGQDSSFAFTCSIDKDGLGDITRRKNLADDALDRDGYVGFHDFWHAVRIWEMTGGWSVGSHFQAGE